MSASGVRYSATVAVVFATRAEGGRSRVGCADSGGRRIDGGRVEWKGGVEGMRVREVGEGGWKEGDGGMEV